MADQSGEGCSWAKLLQQQFKDESDLIDFNDLIPEDYATPFLEDYATPLGLHLDSISEGTTYNVTDESNLPTVDELTAEDIKIQAEGTAFDVQTQVALQVDTGQPFITDMVFKTQLEATDWLDNVGRRVGVVLARGRSDFSKGRNPYIKYVCERGGDMRANHLAKASATNSMPKQKIKPRKSNSKKCGCEFMIRLKNEKKIDGWTVTIVNGIHNHSLNASQLGHAFKWRLKAEEKVMVAKLTKLGMLPKVIRQELKEKNPLNCTSAQSIYNERVKLKKEIREDRSVMQDIFHLAGKEQDGCSFVTQRRRKERLRTYFGLVLPLFHVVGVTNTNKTFTVANGYLWAEKKVNYKWVLEQLCEANEQAEWAIPTTIITDRELALMDAVKVVFPKSDNLLCRWHIQKVVQAKVRPKRKQTEANQILDAWNRIVWSENEDNFNVAIKEMKKLVDEKIMMYLDSTWLCKYKERFVSIWTNNFFHLGSTETQRVKSAHSSLKQWLGTSNCDLVTGWNAIKSMREDQWDKIIESFELSRTKWPTKKFQEKWCRYLRGNVSMHALEMLEAEMDRVSFVGVSVEKCGCVLRKMYGLPCAHELSPMLQQSEYIPRTSLHTHWRKLDIEWSQCENEVDPKLDPYLNDFVVAYDSIPSTMGKLEFIKRLREATFPSTTSLSQPHIKLNPKGRPPSRKNKRKAKNDWTDENSTKWMPSLFEFVEQESLHAESLEAQSVKDLELRQEAEAEALKKATELNDYSLNIGFVHEKWRDFIQTIKDVKGDGNCGYRSVALALGRSEEEYRNVRQELMKELRENEVIYDKILKLKDCTKKLIAKVDCKCGKCVSKYWMDTPTMLWSITQTYNCVAVMLSVGNASIFNLSCLPTRHPPMQVPPRVICVLHRCKHFLCVSLKDGCSLPQLLAAWKEHASPDVHDAWMKIVGKRFEAGRKLFEEKIDKNDFVVLDDSRIH